MKTDTELKFSSPRRVFFKLTILGCVIIGFVYSFLLLFNTVLKAIH